MYNTVEKYNAALLQLKERYSTDTERRTMLREKAKVYSKLHYIRKTSVKQVFNIRQSVITLRF